MTHLPPLLVWQKITLFAAFFFGNLPYVFVHFYPKCVQVLVEFTHIAEVFVPLFRKVCKYWTKLLVVITCPKKAPERVQAAAEYSPIISLDQVDVKYQLRL